MSIGDEIRRIRRSRDMTQEQLAEYLNISPQAVSRWETGQAMPDISLLPGIANLFEVSLDELFGMDEMRNQEYRGGIFRRAHGLMSQNKHAEAAEVYREALKVLPRDCGIMSDLALALAVGGASGADGIKEAAALCERVLRDSTHDKLRSTTRVVLCFLLASLPDRQAALEECRKLPHIWESREMVYPELLEGEKRAQGMKKAVLSALSLLCGKIDGIKSGTGIKNFYAVGPSEPPEDKDGVRDMIGRISSFLDTEL